LQPIVVRLDHPLTASQQSCVPKRAEFLALTLR